ncbi:phosphate ABC transporter substrate-binding protein [Aurantivibrio plasticivorans]
MKKLLIFIMTLFMPIAVVAEVAVVVAASSPLSSIDLKELEKLYLGKSKSLGDVSVSALNQVDSSDVTTEFNRVLLNKSNSQVKAYWSKLVFTGKGTPPKEFNSDSEVIQALKNDSSAIGYIDAGAVSGDVKVLTTLK